MPLVDPDAPVQDLLDSGLGVEVPALVVLGERDREGPVLGAHHQDGARIGLVLDVGVRLGQLHEPLPVRGIGHRIARDQVLQVGAEHAIEGIVALLGRGLDQGHGGGVRGLEAHGRHRRLIGLGGWGSDRAMGAASADSEGGAVVVGAVSSAVIGPQSRRPAVRAASRDPVLFMGSISFA
jgi:hypothetical protein